MISLVMLLLTAVPVAADLISQAWILEISLEISSVISLAVAAADVPTMDR